jgi:lipopolysaccharide export system permease protein
MRLLDRYLLRELLIPLGYCLSGFLVFWISFDLFSELSGFQEKGSSAAEILRYYLVKTPEFLVVVMPIGLLLALLYALTNHSRHNELTAMRAAGVSLVRLSVPYLAVGFAFTVILFALNELWVPRSAEAAEEILRGNRARTFAPGEGRWYPHLNFDNARDGRTWNIGAYNLDTHEMKNPQVAWRLADGSRRTLIATNAVRANGGWVFYDVQELQEFPPQPNLDFDYVMTRTNVLAVPEFTETPEQIKSEIKVSRLSSIKASKEAQLSISEILNYFRLHPELSPRDFALLHTQLQARLAWPWTCLVVVLIAIPFGVSGDRRNVFVGVASSIFICFSFFILLRLGLALGTGGSIPPWAAAWLPDLIFSAAGIGLILRVR